MAKLPQAFVDHFVSALHGMARANWYEFARSPELCRSYYENLRARRFKYVPDRYTCGHPDCWSTYRALAERYPEGQKILLDCEDAACAHAGWLASQCYTDAEILVGLVPGVKISHAVCGVRQGGRTYVVDPSRWFGMGPTHYEGVQWKDVRQR